MARISKKMIKQIQAASVFDSILRERFTSTMSGYFADHAPEMWDGGQKEIFDILWQQAVPPKMREFLSKLRTDGFVRIAEGYTDAGAAEKTDKTAVAKD